MQQEEVPALSAEDASFFEVGLRVLAAPCTAEYSQLCSARLSQAVMKRDIDTLDDEPKSRASSGPSQPPSRPAEPRPEAPQVSRPVPKPGPPRFPMFGSQDCQVPPTETDHRRRRIWVEFTIFAL
jgi:hypothetical protein